MAKEKRAMQGTGGADAKGEESNAIGGAKGSLPRGIGGGAEAKGEASVRDGKGVPVRENECRDEEALACEGDCRDEDAFACEEDCRHEDALALEGDCRDEEAFACEGDCLHEDALARVRDGMRAPAELDRAAELFKALSDPTRLRIVNALSIEEICVCDLAELLGMSQPAVSHHLKTLRAERLVRTRRAGKTIFYSLDDAHVLGIVGQGLLHVSHE